ncbi:hypothetical protein ACLOJK_013546 [Asimina triloba]
MATAGPISCTPYTGEVRGSRVNGSFVIMLNERRNVEEGLTLGLDLVDLVNRRSNRGLGFDHWKESILKLGAFSSFSSIYSARPSLPHFPAFDSHPLRSASRSYSPASGIVFLRDFELLNISDICSNLLQTWEILALLFVFVTKSNLGQFADCGSWFYEQKLSPWQAPKLSFGIPDPGPQNFIHPMAFPAFGNFYGGMDAPGRITSELAAAEIPEMNLFSGNEPRVSHGCYNHQASAVKPMLGDKFSVSQCHDTAPNHKSFVVFDHSANRTSLIFSTAAYQLQNPFSMCQKLRGDRRPSDPLINIDAAFPGSMKEPVGCGLNENNDRVISGGQGSEMHEDTEEINALLYSDEEDEETSTGHSPSEMTGYEKEEAKYSAEVASCALTPSKRRRLERECDPCLLDTASSGRARHHEDDAELSCVKRSIQGGKQVRPPSKRVRRERIREAVGILRSIIPGGKGKDATVVLDEAISYLKSLRLKARAL